MTDQQEREMRITYELLDMPAAIGMDAPDTEWRKPQPDAPFANQGWEYVKGIWRCEDGVPVEFIGEDGGEPEDQTLGRDWKWVLPALRAAFKLGRESGEGG